ncbi:CHASE domain-containing protein|uniref:sensor histidine kinase n=1 Tax=Noviherbaspirillum sp. L7-7A TaxID=2850560 RepID=UPI001C2BC7FB|nr:CHASE domain-containing protein [Noviherbaspirillum sp. L7-7A]MBV0878766.1 CHASE domain-containing protein [Noviherbaspirillum sp. L7-7A]
MHRQPFPFPSLLPALLCLILGLLATAALYTWTRDQELAMEQLIFDRRASFRIQTVRQGLEEVVETIEDVSRVFATFGPISQAQFHAFVGPLAQAQPYFNSISFLRLVPHAERAAYEARMRAGNPSFEISDLQDGKPVRAADRDNYLVVEYLEPGTLNGLAGIGFDVLMEPSIRSAVQRATETGEASATAVFRYLFVPPSPPRLIVFKAIYREGMPLDTPEARHAAVYGYSGLGMPTGKLIENILDESGLGPINGMDMAVYVGQGRTEALAFQYGEGQRDRRDAGLRTSSQSFPIGGVSWRVDVRGTDIRSGGQVGSWLVALFGVIISVMAAIYLRALGSRTRHIHQLVEERTAALHAANIQMSLDIAARERVEGVLRRTERSLKNAQRIAHVGSWEMDVANGWQHWSDECFRIFGMEPEVDNMPVLSRLPGKTRAMWRSFLADVLDHACDTCEMAITRPDGTVRHVMLHAEVTEGQPAASRTIVGTVLDISEFKQVETELRRSQKSLRELGGHQERIKENERQRIAREIHDELGGVLTGIKAYVSVASSRVGNDTQAAPLLAEAMAQADSALDTVRRVIADLRPSVLDQLGVWEAIEWQASQLEAQTGVHCQCVIEPDLPVIGADGGAMLFRIAQEALTNVARHAQATVVTITVRLDQQQLLLDIEDDGKGIPAEQLLAPESWGLRGMQERALYLGGTLNVGRGVRQGTLVSLRLPLSVKMAALN